MIKRLQLWIRNIFGFSRAETNGLLILLPMMLVIIFSQPIYRLMIDDPPLSFDEDQAKIDSLVAHWDFNPNEKPAEIPLFYFDPNSAAKKEFDSLGFPSYLGSRIINYRTKGGHFTKPADLLKIYGMDTPFYEKLLPFILIESSPGPVNQIKRDPVSKNKKEEKAFSFDINRADTSQLKLIKGIGTILAARIVKYRDALGGFYDMAQINEVFGLDSTVVMELLTKSFIDPLFTPRQLDINQATERDFSQHPYISSKLAKTIMAYRFQHGSFTDIDDLLKIDLIDQQKLDKLRPYLKVD